MRKTTIFSFFVTLFIMQWHTISVESADTVEAKVTGAMQKTTNNPVMAVVEDEDVKSGWNVEIKRAIKQKESSDNLYIYFYARTDPKAEYEIAYAASLCQMLRNGSAPSKFLPKQVTDMIFPRQKGSCEFKPSERAIRASAQVNTDHIDDSPDKLPKTTPYQLEARILTNHQASNNNDDEYLFKVCFDIGGDINKK